MKNYNAIYWIIVCILAASCSYATLVPSKPFEATITPQSSPYPRNHSFRARWEMVDQSISGNNSSSIIVYAMKLTSQNTMVICSVVSDKDVLNQQDFSILLRDNLGESNLLSKNTLASIGSVSFWVIEFEARNIGANEISLVTGQNNSSTTYVSQIAKFVESPEDPAVFSGRTYMIGTGQAIEQGGYLISFEGWVPPPSSVKPSSVGASGNATIIDKATLRIEHISNGKIDYLFLQFLPNGETTSELIQ